MFLINMDLQPQGFKNLFTVKYVNMYTEHKMKYKTF